MTASHEPRLARVAALVADPARSRMLADLLSGEYASAGELAKAASVTAATASGHLGRLLAARFVVCEPRGRHRDFRLADAEVAHALEAQALVARGGRLRAVDLPQGFLGILMLDTRFPRPVGDVGNPETYSRAGIPVRFATVRGASPQRVVHEADPALLQPFLDAALELQRHGASMLSTSCGFLARWQATLSRALAVPVVTSSLLQVSRCRRPGIVTIAAASLTPAVLDAAGVPAGTPLQGVEPGCEFHRRILANDSTMDLAQAERNVVAAALRLVGRHPEVAEIVLECTNMPPYRNAVARATGRPVHDIETLLLAEWAGLAAGS